MRHSERDERSEAGRTLAKAMGWFGIGLGAAQLLAPKRVARFAGLPAGPIACRNMRLFGAREVLSGIMILRGKQSSGLAARVAGDLLDLSVLGSSLGSARGLKRLRRSPARQMTALASVAAVTVLDVVGYRKTTSVETGKSGSQKSRSPYQLKASITIDRTAQDLYTFWRDVENLPRFVTQVAKVEGIDEVRSRWTAKVGGAPVTWEASITEDRPGELIRWRTEAGPAAQVMSGGEVRFTPAPGGRGTEVHVSLETPGPSVTGALARWLRKLPQKWLGHELHLFKQLMELGEITKAQARFSDAPHPALPNIAGTPTSEIAAKPFFSDRQGATS